MLYLQECCYFQLVAVITVLSHVYCLHLFQHLIGKQPDFQARLQQHEFWCSVHLLFDQLLLIRPFFRRTICTLVYLYHSRIYARIFHIRITGKHMEYFLPYAYFLPFSEACINTLPRSITFWYFPPLGTCSCNPQHSIQHTAVIFCWASLFACSFRRQYIFNSFPFFIADFISFHILKYITFFAFCATFIFQTRPRCTACSVPHASGDRCGLRF